MVWKNVGMMSAFGPAYYIYTLGVGARALFEYSIPPVSGWGNKTHNKSGTSQQNEVCRLRGIKYKL
jgi:hypothetical protein